jgi:hypothetical protein
MSDKIDQARILRSGGKTFKEIAAILDCSEGYLRGKLSGVPKCRPVQAADVIKDRLQRISTELQELLDTL